MQPNPKAACNSPQNYTEHSLRLRTNGRSGSSKNNGEGKYTWPLPHTYTHVQTHTQSHIPLVHFTHMVNKKFIMLLGQQWGEVTQVTLSCCLIHHIELQVQHLDCSSGHMTADVRNAALSHCL